MIAADARFMSTRAGAAPWVAILAVAGLARLGGLESRPLDASEAALGLAVLRGEEPTTDFGPLLHHLTALVFWLFTDSDAALRLLPALAGVAAAVVPITLVPLVGRPTALLAAAIVALAPIGVEASRRADPAAVSMLVVMLAICGAARLSSDAPRWASWLVAAAVGLALVHQALAAIGIIVVAATALLASALVGRPVFDDAAAFIRRLTEARQGWLATAAGVALLATGGLASPGGLAHPLGGLWGALPAALALGPLSVSASLSVVAYTGPLLALAVVQLARGFQRPDLLDLRLALSAFGFVALSLAASAPLILDYQAMATIPLALLAGRALAVWVSRPIHWSGAAVAAMAVSLASIGAVVLLVADTVGTGRGISRAAPLGVFLLGGLLTVSWRGVWRERTFRAAGLGVGGVLIVAWLVSTVARLSLGASPPGSEPLATETTAPQFRSAFTGLLADARRATDVQLAVRTAPAEVGRWYGRTIPVQPEGAAGSAIVVQTLDDARFAAPTPPVRTPWRTVSTVRREDLHPLGIARWLATRQGLLIGRPEDVVIQRPVARP